MRIVIDMQGAQTGSRFRGIGRYTLSLVKAMLRHHNDHEFVLLLNGLFQDTIQPLKDNFGALIDQKHIRIWHATGPVFEMHECNAWRQRSAQILQKDYIDSIKPDLILFTTFFEGIYDDCVCSVNKYSGGTATAFIFYDMIPYIYPEHYLADPRTCQWYKNKIKDSKHANLLLAISESSRREAIKTLEVTAEKVVNISAGRNDDFFVQQFSISEQQDFLSKFGLNKPYLMYLSATDWRKNHKRLIEAYSYLSKEIRNQHQLLFAGSLPPHHEQEFKKYAKTHGLKDHELVITSFVTDEDIFKLYNMCKTFVFPSLHEGFGLPALEAMQCGRAVIGSNTSSVPEVIGNSEALFDPFDVEDIHRLINRVLADDLFREQLEQYSLIQIEKFSWENSAKVAIGAIETLFQAHPQNQPVIDEPGLQEPSDRLISLISSIPHKYSEQDLLGISRSIAMNTQKRTDR